MVKVAKPTIKEMLGEAKKKTVKKAVKKAEAAKSIVKEKTNINFYNKTLFILETVLFMGVIDEFLEGMIMKYDFGIYMNIFLIMLAIGILFTAAFKMIEPIMKNVITKLVRLNDNKIIRFMVHFFILSLLYYLYAKVFYSVDLSLNFDIGLNATAR